MFVSIMLSELKKKNAALKYLGRTVRGKKRFVFSKLGNELTLITTKLCNLNCPFCYDKANIYDKNVLKNIKSELNWKQMVNLIAICKRLGVNNIRLTGGEAVLKEGFFEILKACDGMYVSLCSNGLVLKKYLDKIIEIHPKDLHVHLSLEGLETHYQYRRGSNPYDVINLASFIKRQHPHVKVSINTVINKDNIYELSGVYALLKNANIDRWTISFPRLVENALERNFKVPNISNLIRETKKLLTLHYLNKKPFEMTISYFYKYELSKKNTYKKPDLKLAQHPCLPDANGTRGLIVDSFGNILDCLTLKPMLKKPVNLKKMLSKKNLSVEDFILTLYKSLNSKFYDLKFKDRNDCRLCRYLPICKGGCPANAYYLFGNLNAVDILSCVLFYSFETEFISSLNKAEKKLYSSLIDKRRSIEIIKKRIKKNKRVLIKIGCFT